MQLHLILQVVDSQTQHWVGWRQARIKSFGVLLTASRTLGFHSTFRNANEDIWHVLASQ